MKILMHYESSNKNLPSVCKTESSKNSGWLNRMLYMFVFYVRHALIGGAAAVASFSIALASQPSVAEDGYQKASYSYEMVSSATIEDLDILKPYMDISILDEVMCKNASVCDILDEYVKKDSEFKDVLEDYFQK